MGLENSLVQILVLVANIKVEYLKIEVEKGFKQTLIELELVDLDVLINIENDTIKELKKLL